jgi:hypothetical protein
MAYFGADQSVFSSQQSGYSQHSIPDQTLEQFLIETANQFAFDPMDYTFEPLDHIPALENPAPELVQLPRSPVPTDRSQLHLFNAFPVTNERQPPNNQAPNNFPSIATSSMLPPSGHRKPKAPTLRAQDWEPYKARIVELHIDQKLPLREVKDKIEQEFGFKAEYV